MLTHFILIFDTSIARYVFNLAFENKISVSVTAHPTMIQVEDLQKYLEVSKAPLLINSCTTDPQFPPEKIEAADRILGGGKFAPGYERVHWEGCTHGFAVRGDIVRLSPLFGLSSCFSPPVSS